MRVSLDCAGCDKDGRVLWFTTLAPWHIGPRISGCAYIWEAASGTLCERVCVGDILVWEAT